MTLRRLDAELVRRGMAPSRESAKSLVESGSVELRGTVVTKPHRQIDTDDPLVVRAQRPRQWVSRGAFKLLSALEAFAEVNVKGSVCLDAGASTGGFTEVLLDRGAERVFAVDVGYGQLAWSLQIDERVTALDRTNVRYLSASDLPELPDLVVSDLSFISLRTVLSALRHSAAPKANFVLMVKPQFEVGKRLLGKGGVVRDPELRLKAVRDVAEYAYSMGLGCAGVAASQLPGPNGNVEYFLWLHADAPQVSDDALNTAIAEGPP